MYQVSSPSFLAASSSAFMSARADSGPKSEHSGDGKACQAFHRFLPERYTIIVGAIRSHGSAMSQASDRSAGWAAYYQQLRDRPPRRTLVMALDLFGDAPADALAVDLGCGDGRDIVELLRRGWRVVAVDSEPEALRQLAARNLPGADRITPITARFEEVPLPLGVQLVNSSFAMPLCEPEAFRTLWARIREALPAGRTVQRPMVWRA